MPFEASNNDSDEDEEFMSNMNVYLNTSSASIEEGALRGILRRGSSFNKVIRFEMDEDEKEDARLDEERNRQELLSKISRLTDMLKTAEETVQAEKDKRKKKDKNLMKLAKELKRRNSQKEVDAERMEELEEKKKYLEHHWVLAQKELDQEKALRIKLQNEMKIELERGLVEQREKYDRAVSDHKARISELQAAHAKQCDELCAEILKANLESDRLANQIRSDGYTPRGFPDSGRDAIFGKVAKVLAVVVVITAFIGYQVGMFSMDAVCAPVMPGRTLRSRDAGSTFYAPWWAPEEHKVAAFKQICSTSMEPTQLEWISDGKDNKAVLSSGNKILFTRKGLVKADVEGSLLRVWNRKGMSEEYGSLWSVLNSIQ